MVILSDDRVHIGTFHVKSPGGHFLLAAHGCRKGGDLLLLPVIDSLEILSASDRPVDRAGADPQHVLDVIHQFKGISGLPVHLVDERKDGDPPQDTDLKQLDGLGLHALGSVDNHDGAVRRHQGPVSVLGKVLVARRVQDIDTIVVIFKLHNRRGDGDSSLLLDLHPVRHRVFGGLPPFYRACQVDGSAVEEKFLRQRGLARIRVRYDGKGSSLLDFFCYS